MEGYRLEYLNSNTISMGDRGRVDYGDLDDLVEDIEANGLICPITVVDTYKVDNPKFKERANGRQFLLMAGGRRITACRMLKFETIPCNIYERELDELDFRIIELMENVKRKDLSPMEDLKQKEEIHRLHVEKYGVKSSTTPGAAGHSMSDTAKLLGVARSGLSSDLTTIKEIEELPELAEAFDKCETKAEAKKLLRKVKKRVETQVRADEAREQIAGSGGIIKNVVNSYLIGDFFEVASDIPDESFDLIELDPPYAIELERIKKGYTYKGYNEIPANHYLSFIGKMLAESYRILKPNGWIICWFGPDPWFEIIHRTLTECKFKTRRLPCLWVKGEETDENVIEKLTGQTMAPKYHLAQASEMFFYGAKGSPTLNREGRTNIFPYKPIPAQHKSHPTERPVEMISDVLTTFVGPGSKIFVPCLGSGNTLLAAYSNDMMGLGTDISEEFKDSFVLKAQEMFGKEKKEC